MTERLYYEDVYMTEFDAAVLGCTKEGEQWRIIPDRSAFYPEGGGQSGDRGSLTVLSSGEEIEVSDTREDGDDVVHLQRSGRRRREDPGETELGVSV